MKLDEIIEELRDANYAHFTEFYNETKKTVFFAIVSVIKDRDVVDDLMQDTYIKFLENISKFKSKTNINAFLSTMAHNIAINYYNKEKRVVKDEAVFDFIPDEGNKTKTYEEIKVVELLKELDDISKQVVILHVINELKFREIASIIDKPLGTVLWIYNKAINELKERMQEENENK